MRYVPSTATPTYDLVIATESTGGASGSYALSTTVTSLAIQPFPHYLPLSLSLFAVFITAHCSRSFSTEIQNPPPVLQELQLAYPYYTRCKESCNIPCLPKAGTSNASVTATAIHDHTTQKVTARHVLLFEV